MMRGMPASCTRRLPLARIAFTAAVVAAAGCAEVVAATEAPAAGAPNDAPTGSAPRFVSPAGAGTVFDRSRERCLAIPVEVADPDSRAVTVAMRFPSPESATLAPDGSRRHRLVWGPDGEPAGERLERFVLAAQDADHPAVEKTYLVLLRR
ncbi:MAG: hypothetical protein HY907_16320 [Deltaproteobacteria bacterium]|nr:hypothetical protein [Deltaproteobacteria bacterium]